MQTSGKCQLFTETDKRGTFLTGRLEQIIQNKECLIKLIASSNSSLQCFSLSSDSVIFCFNNYFLQKKKTFSARWKHSPITPQDLSNIRF